MKIEICFDLSVHHITSTIKGMLQIDNADDNNNAAKIPVSIHHADLESIPIAKHACDKYLEFLMQGFTLKMLTTREYYFLKCTILENMDDFLARI